MAGNNGTVTTSPRDILAVLFRRRRMILVVFATVTALVVVVTCLRAPVYQAEAHMLIRLGRENLAMDPSVSGPTVNPYVNRDNEVHSELAILQSRDLAEGLVDSLGPETILGRRPSSEEPGAVGAAVRNAKSAVAGTLAALNILPPVTTRNKAVRRVMRSFSAEVGKRDNIISATYEAHDPEIARQALDYIVTGYLKRHIEVYATQATPDFFEAQVGALGAELTDRQRALEAFRTQHRIADLAQEKSTLIERISSARSEADLAAAAASAHEARAAALRNTLAGRPTTREIVRTTGKTNVAADSLKERLSDLRLQETDLSARYPDSHRPLVQVREQIAQLEASLAAENATLTEVTTGLDERREALQFELDSEVTRAQAEKARHEVLLAQLARHEDMLATLVAREVELDGLAREAQLAEKAYRDYHDSLQRARISTAMDMDRVSNISVVQAATVFPAPVRPNKPVDIVLGMIAALFLAVTLAFVRDHFDSSVRSREQLEKSLGIPVLAVLREKSYT